MVITNGILELVDGSGSFDGEFKLKTGTGSALATPADRLTVTSTDITANTGNIVFGTSGKGVHLGVTSATASNLKIQADNMKSQLSQYLSKSVKSI